MRGPLHRYHQGLAGAAGTALAVGVAALLAALPGPAAPRTRAAPAPQFELPAPAPQPIEAAPAGERAAPLESEVQRIDAPSATSPPPISAPPITAPTLQPKDTQARTVRRELQQLQKMAAPASGYGSTAAAAQAAWQLGLIYLHGAGVRVDRPLAQQWFERAARQGRESWAYAGLAWCTMDGCSAPANPAAATRAIEQLRATHPGRADYLAWLQATQLHPLRITAPNPRSSNSSAYAPQDVALLERAAASGDVPATIELGILAFTDQDVERAQTYFRRVAPRSSVAAHNLKVLQVSNHSTSDPLQASTSNAAQAALEMAQMYHRGQGVPANFAEAVRFYRLAEQRGSTQAHKMLELIFSQPMPDGSLNAAWMQQLAQVDVSTPVAALNSGVQTPQLQRLPTPLFDLLPAFWRQQVLQIAGA
ncbi:tetratricopeptide repeat protein [Comamonas jiangduensis]|uniref:tetratricopeptide repeat protein n=1 Tax=Comamonas jiangduensis TaxID=1194168 RepID=UPI0024E0D620|nr:hypothetical protein [Comamonas jiangduensis]